MRLGGELRGEGERDFTKHAARVLFLEGVEELAPHVLESLRDDVLPAYTTAFEEDEPPARTVEPRGPCGVPVERQGLPAWVGYRFERSEEDQGVEPPEHMREALVRWACRFNLEAPWLLGSAFTTLRFWKYGRWNARGDDAEESALRFAEPYFMDADQAPALELPSFKPWHPRWETWAEYKQAFKKFLRGPEVRDAFQRYKKDRMRAYPDSDGGVQKRGDPTQHFRWFVRFQVLEQTLESIAASPEEENPKEHVALRSVQRAIKDVEELIGLKRRSL